MLKSKITYKTDDNFLPPFVKWLCGCLSALVVGGLAAWWLAPIAYEERGYSAVGGEWVLVLAVIFVALQLGKLLSGMIATILYRMAGSPRVGVTSFGDVATSTWYADAIMGTGKRHCHWLRKWQLWPQ